MLVRGLVRLLSVVGPLLILIVVAAHYYHGSPKSWSFRSGGWSSGLPSGWTYTDRPKDDGLKVAPNIYDLELAAAAAQGAQGASDPITTTPDDLPVAPNIYDLEQAAYEANQAKKPPSIKPAADGSSKSPPDHGLSKTPSAASDQESGTHNVLFSLSTSDRTYFALVFGDQATLNPNIIPHPTLNDTWIMVAQKINDNDEEWPRTSTELVCDAQFQSDGSLACVHAPVTLPIAATTNAPEACQGKWEVLTTNVGPHDGRVFYGPEVPYTVYGSNSGYTCFGQWMQDFRSLVNWTFDDNEEIPFTGREAYEIQRPAPFGPIEKNWFIFWDVANVSYVHYDLSPIRSFAKLEADGSAGTDVAIFADRSDSKCLTKYLPTLMNPENESIHQATNSLAVTLCKRAETDCVPTAYNTFLVAIVQHKKFFSFHSVYEPYVILFRQSAPFEIYAISEKPLWIAGRGRSGFGGTHDQTEMLYMTSMSWRDHGQTYHGYLDDVLFLSFGVEDSHTGAVDVVAEDLIRDMGLCSNA